MYYKDVKTDILSNYKLRIKKKLLRNSKWNFSTFKYEWHSITYSYIRSLRGSWSKIRQKWPILVKTFEFLPYGNNHYFFPRWEGVVSKKSFLDGRGHFLIKGSERKSYRFQRTINQNTNAKITIPNKKKCVRIKSHTLDFI